MTYFNQNKTDKVFRENNQEIAIYFDFMYSKIIFSTMYNSMYNTFRNQFFTEMNEKNVTS